MNNVESTSSSQLNSDDQPGEEAQASGQTKSGNATKICMVATNMTARISGPPMIVKSTCNVEKTSSETSENAQGIEATNNAFDAYGSQSHETQPSEYHSITESLDKKASTENITDFKAKFAAKLEETTSTQEQDAKNDSKKFVVPMMRCVPSKPKECTPKATVGLRLASKTQQVSTERKLKLRETRKINKLSYESCKTRIGITAYGECPCFMAH